jgi:hypothetical protein
MCYRRSNIAINSFSIPLIRLSRHYSDKHRDTYAPIVGLSGSAPLHFVDANDHTNVHYYYVEATQTAGISMTLLRRCSLGDWQGEYG